MRPEEAVLQTLNFDTENPAVDARLRVFVVDLERSGVAPREIAGALARVMLGFCAEQARTIENYGWVLIKLTAVTHMLERRQSEANYRNWVSRFLRRTHRLYNEARMQIRADTTPPPLPPFAVEASKPQGNA